MMRFGWLYELQPFGYLLAAVTVLVLLPTPVGLIAFGALYLAGAVVWCLRSHHRRADRRRAERLPASLRYVKKRLLPAPLYELLPFLYGALALLLASAAVPAGVWKIFAAPLLVYAILRLGQRCHHRQHSAGLTLSSH